MNPELNEIFQPEIRVKKLKLENFRGFDRSPEKEKLGYF